MMEINSRLAKSIAYVIIFLAIIIFGLLRAYKKHRERPTRLDFLLIILFFTFAIMPLLAITVWYDQISNAIKTIAIFSVIISVVSCKLYMWRKYRVLWGLPKGCYGKEDSEKN